MHALASMRSLRKLALIPLLLLAGCGQGNGPTPIPGTPAPPPPPAGACEPINFEEECELPTIINFNGGASTVIDNPDKSGINVTNRVAQMQKFPDEVFGGTKLTVPDGPIDFSQGEFYLVKVWSPRDVTVSFKLEEEGNPGGGLTVDQNHPGGSEWRELCFDFTGQSVPPPVLNLTIIFDNGTLGLADTDPDNWTFFYDEIKQVQECAPTFGTPIDPDATLFSSSGDPTLVIPDDYAERTAFGSGSIIDPMYADDEFFSPVLSVWSGSGYGANVAQVGFIGFPARFLGAYLSVDFKVKGMPNQVIFVKLHDGVDTLRINLTSSAFSEPLPEDGWFQVSIPVDRFSGVDTATGIIFESDNTSLDQFRMLLTDVGFSGMGTGGPLPPFDGGLVTNGGFEDGTSPWLAGVDNPIDMGNIIDDALDPGNSVYFVNVTAADPGQPFLVNLSQRGLTITPDETYELTFRARSNVSRTMLAGIGLSGGSFANTTQTVALTTAWQDFTVTLTATGFGDADSRVLFDMGAEVGEVYIDNVRLVTGMAPPPPPFDGGLVTNGGFEDGTSPWLAGVDNPIDMGNIIDDALDPGNSVYFVNVTAAGNPFDVNLSQRGLTITPDETYELTFRARSNVSRTMLAGIGLSGGSFANVTETIALTTAWQDFTVTLTATGFGDADSRVLFDMGAEVGEVYIDNVRLVVSSGGGGPPGGNDIAVNGGFEAGDLSDWALFPVSADPNEQTVVTANPKSGTYAGRINNTTPGSASIIKQANLTPVAIGQTATITFSARGSFGPGGVAFAEFFTEVSGGGASSAQILGGGPLVLDADPNVWADFNFVVPITADVSGGVTLQLTGTTGGDASSFADVYYDDIAIVITD